MSPLPNLPRALLVRRTRAAAPEIYTALRDLVDAVPPGDDFPCHFGITTKDKCGRCSRQLAARAALALVEGPDHGR